MGKVQVTKATGYLPLESGGGILLPKGQSVSLQKPCGIAEDNGRSGQAWTVDSNDSRASSILGTWHLAHLECCRS